jgi:iron complex outermembrane receptor protein
MKDMKFYLLRTTSFFFFLFIAASLDAQSIRIKVANADTGEPIPGASVVLLPIKRTLLTDSSGMVHFTSLTPGKYTLEISHIGFETLKNEVTLGASDHEHQVLMEHEHEEEEEVVIQSTRSTRTIQNIPTRVEFIAGEELDEKANMKPGDIRMVLSESTGIQTQQTSATSGNSSIRIQGLDGRYTQVLKDGFPVYAGFSSGLGLLQTPPLDLKQFEVIKGSASTLYGGGAIAGLVNLISKTPEEESELKFHLDATSAGGWNTSGFYGQRFGKVGATLFASRNSNAAYDPSNTGLTAIPEFERYTLNPRLFFYFNEKTTLNVGANLTIEDRTGGDLEFIRGNKPSGFFEKNSTDRMNTVLTLKHNLSLNSELTFRNSLSRYQRVIMTSSYLFNGTQDGSFSELVYSMHGDQAEWIGGLNLVTDKFTENRTGSFPLRNYEQLTAGAFLQNTWKFSDRFHLETGIRGDHVKDYGFAFLPRIAALFRFTPALSSRIGAGMGYKAPTIFTEESERLLYRDVLPIDPGVNKLERSYGFNADINYKATIGDELDFSINQFFFYTRIDDPLLLFPGTLTYRFLNANGHIDTRGMETNIRLGYGDFKLFVGYTFTHAYLHQGGDKAETFLTPKHRLNNVLLYEVHEKWKVGLEAYYFSNQSLSDGTIGKSYWITGFMAEKLWEKFSLYINFENFLDTRQTAFDSIHTGTIDNPVFRDIYAPLDGFVVNGGIKLRL